MRTPQETDPGTAAVIAAQRGDRSALDDLVAAYLPLVYNIVGRALNGHPDTDDVVQETMLRAIGSLGDLRDPEAFRSWLVAIAMRRVRDSYRDRLAQAPAVDSAAHSPDFADLTILLLGLSGQRRETAAATRWLDEEDQPVLALWWQEAAGELSRAELADALGVPPAHAAVRIARLKERLTTARMVVRALGRVPHCDALAAVAASWDGVPSALWRKRLARHVRDCSWCQSDVADMIPAERLLGGLPLLAAPAEIAGRALSRLLVSHPMASPPAVSQPVVSQPVVSQPAVSQPVVSQPAVGSRVRSARHARHTRLLGKGAVSLQPKLLAASLAVLTCAAGGTFAVTRTQHAAAPAALSLASPATAVAARPSPLVTHAARVNPARKPALPATVTSQRKGVAVWNFTGVTKALTESGASWYYDWAATPNGIAAPAKVSFVPMIWGAANVTTATLAEVRGEGRILLGFNEPDMSGQANMTVAKALSLWPKLMATGMTLGSPAVAYDAATPGGWLDQFMAGAKARHYRVNFITVHWYGGDFRTVPATQELETYLKAIWSRYHLPIWVTEFALTSFSGSTATYPTEGQQAAFLTAATKMLDSLSYVHRYAWFALPVSAGSGTTGLFNPGPSVTQVGRAFEAARLAVYAAIAA